MEIRNVLKAVSFFVVVVIIAAVTVVTYKFFTMYNSMFYLLNIFYLL